MVGQTDVSLAVATYFAGAPALQKQIIKGYPQLPGQTGYDVIAEIYTDYIFVCTTSLYTAIAASAGYPIWRYHFNASFPNTQGFPGAGVYHSSEIPIVFGTYAATNTTSQEYALSNAMQSAWARFAKEPMSGPGWGMVGGKLQPDLGVFGANGTAGVTVVSQAEIDGRCGLYDPIYEIWIGGIKP